MIWPSSHAVGSYLTMFNTVLKHLMQNILIILVSWRYDIVMEDDWMLLRSTSFPSLRIYLFIFFKKDNDECKHSFIRPPKWTQSSCQDMCSPSFFELINLKGSLFVVFDTYLQTKRILLWFWCAKTISMQRNKDLLFFIFLPIYKSEYKISRWLKAYT